MDKKSNTVAMAAVILIAALWLTRFPVIACPADGKVCGDCIRDRMKLDCPTCAPVLRCMAKCLWRGESKSPCTRRCDCNGARPRLSLCKQCMNQCKCSCASSSK